MMLPKFIAPVIVAGLLIFTVHLSTALAQGTTTFTYQGHLLNNGTDASGTNGLIFTLYSAVTGGSVVGAPITNSLAVSNGLFTVNLDFGTGAFNGSARWLDIAVSNGITNVELSPRAQVLPTPYATYAATAGTATSAMTATNFAGGGTFAGNGGGLTNVAANLEMEVFASPGSFSFIVPTNVSRIIVEAWGGGGGGGSGSTTFDIGGGGGGAGGYAKIFYNVIPGDTYSVIVGLAGNAGGAGGSSDFGGNILATGGSAGGAGTSPAGPGGAGGNGPGEASTLTSIKGGTGKYGTTLGGGDGGGAGCGGPGGLGNVGAIGSTGNFPGGGGGGGDFSGTITGYAGASGEVIVYY